MLRKVLGAAACAVLLAGCQSPHGLLTTEGLPSFHLDTGFNGKPVITESRYRPFISKGGALPNGVNLGCNVMKNC